MDRAPGDAAGPGKTEGNLASTSSFDVTTGVDFMEAHNAVDQATKEITQRYDFKGLKVSFALDQKEKKITLAAPDEFKLKKVQAAIQGDTVRVSSSSKDDLQGVIALLKGHDFGVELKFGNFRSN